MTVRSWWWILCCAACASEPTHDPRPDAAGRDAGAVVPGADSGATPDAHREDSAMRYDGDRYTGVITSFPLPAIAEAPFSTVIGSKHTNMAAHGDRLYVTGGDWLHSATDGTWSMDLRDGSWREEVGPPVHPTRPAPHALQDGAGFVWIEARSRFLIWPGSYFAYEEPGDPVLEYARGAWWFDPATNEFTQELGLFGDPGSGSGCLFGGVYDEVNDEILTFGDTDAGYAVRRWHVGGLARMADVPFELSLPSGHVAYFLLGQQVKIGRRVYVIGVRTNGESESQEPLFLEWDLDARAMRQLAPPPVDGRRIQVLEIRAGTSHGKVIWPFTRGPEGEIDGIYVYEPSSDRWFVDRQVPDYGAFIGNSVASLPDGRVVFAGGSFGRQSTHIWFYEAP
jgi:hypothetical protein